MLQRISVKNLQLVRPLNEKINNHSLLDEFLSLRIVPNNTIELIKRLMN